MLIFQAHRFLISCLIVFVLFQEIFANRSQAKTKPHVISTEFDTRFKSSDTVITNPRRSCCKRCNINKHNKYCQKNKNKTGQTKNPELHGRVFVCVCACVCACIVRPVILWMSWKFTTQVFTVSPSQKL